ncbi:hypothetical protein [Sphingomonas parapaucimobilis]|uniref:Uncharacterized protein n=1 Tax=Sphingomonas parapaucimobilis NBRC 15100 TaxID=1219049 RepID=A0A0A1W9W6_9SPHN|nr:hypothetical protein [Sphingomonas parapaucimobilis]GAM01719.1 hypothetical protein SP5_068_00870 [Sphingomonas parapaucimobilis NBRC 15100]
MTNYCNTLSVEPHKLVGDKYSPNLRHWLNRNRRTYRSYPLVYQWEDGGRYIGWLDDDDVGYFTGTRLMGALSGGGMGKIFAHVPSWAAQLTEVEGFWQRYVDQGRCAIDPEHKTSFIGDDTRWQVEGDTRNCLWCGNCTQALHRWTEQVERSAWKDAARLNKGQAA